MTKSEMAEFEPILYNALDTTYGSDCLVKFTADCGQFELSVWRNGVYHVSSTGTLFKIVDLYKKVVEQINNGKDSYEDLREFVWNYHS